MSGLQGGPHYSDALSPASSAHPAVITGVFGVEGLKYPSRLKLAPDVISGVGRQEKVLEPWRRIWSSDKAS